MHVWVCINIGTRLDQHFNSKAGMHGVLLLQGIRVVRRKTYFHFLWSPNVDNLAKLCIYSQAGRRRLFRPVAAATTGALVGLAKLASERTAYVRAWHPSVLHGSFRVDAYACTCGRSQRLARCNLDCFARHFRGERCV